MPSLVHCFISPAHNYVGHFGRAPGSCAAVDCATVECVAHRGLRGDRYFDHQDNYKGQVTFFALETHVELCRALGVADRPPSVFRRNLITRELDLPALIGRQFRLGGILFEGAEECRPCPWMDQAFAPGTEKALRGRGGLRARILSSGFLPRDVEVDLAVLDAVHAQRLSEKSRHVLNLSGSNRAQQACAPAKGERSES